MLWVKISFCTFKLYLPYIVLPKKILTLTLYHLVYIDFYINMPYWRGDNSKFPFHETTDIFHPGEVYKMFGNQLFDHFENITICTRNTMSHAMQTNSTVLTKGRQTWCPLMRQSTPNVLAYKRMAQFFETNLGIKATNCLEWIDCFFKFCNLSEIRTKELKIRNEPTWCRSKNQAWSRQLQNSEESEHQGRKSTSVAIFSWWPMVAIVPGPQWRCHLEETSLKEANITNDTVKEYLLRIRNPDNPFSGYPAKGLTHSWDDHYQHRRSIKDHAKRTNRTKKSKGTSNWHRRCKQTGSLNRGERQLSQHNWKANITRIIPWLLPHPPASHENQSRTEPWWRGIVQTSHYEDEPPDLRRGRCNGTRWLVLGIERAYITAILDVWKLKFKMSKQKKVIYQQTE